MRKFAITALVMCAILQTMTSCSKSNSPSQGQNAEEAKPKYLYKILTVEEWEASNKGVVQLPSADKDFIHLAKANQLRPIISKYWMKVPVFYIIKLDTAKLPGKLAYEKNPAGSTKYYHLYNGSIPLNAVVKVKKMTKKNPNG
jgi:uncharacterized protein (DUF952 family)